LRDKVCSGFCRYYKPDKPDPEGCGGLNWLEKRPELAARLARLPSDHGSHLYGLRGDHSLLSAICAECAFRIDGCDFRDPQVSEADCAPCGGLRVVAALAARGDIPGPDQGRT